MISNKNMPVLCLKYYCANCDYGTSKKSSFNNHLNSVKHKKSIFSNQIMLKLCSKFICQSCNKEYKDNSGLWRHKKKCKIIILKHPEEKEIVNEISQETILNILKQNSELQLMLIEQNKTIIELSNKNQTVNSYNTITNKTFNLQLFLNETCKDAMNIMDFVDSIQLQLSDLENVGKLGYVEGISNIITSNLKALDVSQRPVHCADKKREVLYVKDENKWEKEDETKNKIRKAIKRVVTKNQRLIPKFKEAHPDCGEYYSLFSDQYDNIILESVGGSGDNDNEKEDKIIRNISSVTTINKE